MSDNNSYVSALSPEYALLGFLARTPAHGYELHQRLSADLGQIWHINLSQTYNILNRLENQGLIQGALQEQEKLPARRQFHLTEAGRQRFDTWLHAPGGSSVRAIRVEFITRLYFASAISQQLAGRLIDDQIRQVRSGLATLETNLATTPTDQLFNRLGLELRLRQLETILDWLASCRQALRIPGQDYPSMKATDAK